MKEYEIQGIEKWIRSIENHIESNVTFVVQYDANGLVKLKKAELVSRFITNEGVYFKNYYYYFILF